MSKHTPSHHAASNALEDISCELYNLRHQLQLYSDCASAGGTGKPLSHVLAAIRKRGYFESPAYTTRPNPSFHPEAMLDSEEKRRLLRIRKDWQEIFDMVMRGMNGEEIADKLGLARTTTYNRILRMRRCGVLPPDPRKTALALEQRLLDEQH